jgi:N,N'-diacetyllegionaminate synthase
VSILQCTTEYPTPAKDIGLNILEELKKRYNVKVGLSDHSGKIWPLIAAVTFGAEILEFHAVFDRRMFGPDSKASLEIDEIKKAVEGIRFIEEVLDNPINKDEFSREFIELKKIFGKSLAVNKDLRKGSIITFDDLESKKPFGYGIPVEEYKKVIGKKLKVDKKKWNFLRKEDIE